MASLFSTGQFVHKRSLNAFNFRGRRTSVERSSEKGVRKLISKTEKFPVLVTSNMNDACASDACQRRAIIFSTLGLGVGASQFISKDVLAVAAEFADMPALRGKDYGKTKMRYPDYTETSSGLQYKDLRLGSGPTPKIGETVVFITISGGWDESSFKMVDITLRKPGYNAVFFGHIVRKRIMGQVDWDGYTIGYYGRIFEARNKTKGGSFEGDDKDFFKFTVGSQKVIPAFEEAIVGMSPGGVRRIIVPPNLGYPDNDFNKKGPRPTTFSGQRALDFVLRNQGLIDKTLLFDIELIKIVPS